MKTAIRLIITILPLLCLSAAGPKAQAVVPPPDGGYPNFTTAEGQKALFSLTTGTANTAVGWFSLQSLTTGSFNTATGAGALLFNTADANTAFGAAALLTNTIGLSNTAIGAAALLSNTEGTDNTATGFAALYRNTTGANNVVAGYQALYSNTTGDDNTATGYQALYSNTVGYNNNAVGRGALISNTTGLYNNAIGNAALSNNITGYGNNALGDVALNSNTGNNNTAVGDGAGADLTTGSGNVCLGMNVFGSAGESNTTRIRNIYETVQPQVGIDPDYVTVNSSGRLGRANFSSRRYKHDIKPMDNASEAVLALKPVTFRYNEEYDATQTLAYGLIAEDVAQVYPDLVGRNREGQPESVRYEQINAMLLNEFLKEHRKLEKLEATIAEQQKNFQSKLVEQEKRIEALASGFQKVSAQIEASKPAPQVAVNNQ